MNLFLSESNSDKSANLIQARTHTQRKIHMSAPPITITVPLVPVAQPRPRATVRGGRICVYNAAGPVDAFKARVRIAARQAYSGDLLRGPLRVDSEFVFPRTKGQMWKRKPMPRMRHDKKPDRDNLDKAVLDALTGQLWFDDAQVCDGRIQKWIAAGDELHGVIITVTRLTGADLVTDKSTLFDAKLEQ